MRRPPHGGRILSRSRAVLCFLAAIGAAATLFAQAFPEAHPPIGQQPRRPAGYTPFKYEPSAAQLWRDEGAAFAARAHAAYAHVQRTNAEGRYKPAFESLSTHTCPEWFLDAKFGMFVDWGPWSVAGWAPQADKATYPDWYEQRLFTDYRDYHVKTWGPDIGPDDLIQLLRDDAFRPEALIGLAKAAGMRYVVPFLKHHGGYSLWDSSFTHRDSVEWGLHRNIAAEFREATRRSGLRFGAYVSLGEWNYPVVVNGELRTVGFNGEVDGPLADSTPFVSGKVPVEDFTRDYLVPSIAELIETADPDVLWFDGEWESAPETWRSPELTAYFYNRAAASGREVAVNDRIGKDTRGHAGWGDFYTSEFNVIQGPESHPWEENRSLSHSYGYNWEESSDDRFVLSNEAALDLLLRVVSNGGNLLLMVSPDGSGRVPPNQERRLRFLGDWLARNGDAVYGTRSVGLASPPPWGYLTRSKSGDRVYCIVRGWPSPGTLDVPLRLDVKRAFILGAATSVPVTSVDGQPRLTLDGIARPDPDASVIVLEATGALRP